MKQKILMLTYTLLLCSSIIRSLDFFISLSQKTPFINAFSIFSPSWKYFSSVPPKYPLNSFYLVAGGDIMLSRNIGYYNKKNGYDRIFGSGNFNPISQFTTCTSENCLLFFNLESLFHSRDNDIQMGGFTFRANTGNIEVLKQLRYPSSQQVIPPSQGIPLLLSLANNHTINGGYEGIETTKKILHFWWDISHMWAGTTPEEAHQIVQYEFGETLNEQVSICFQAYSYDGKEKIKIWWKTLSRNPIDEQAILQDLAMMKTMHCDVKILSLHRGAEYRLHPNQRQRTLAHTLIDNGADLILGGHSHVPGEIERYNGKYIFYSLGNFIFDQGRGKKATGSEFDYIFDYTLDRKAVPTYISMLAGLKVVVFPNWVKVLLDKIEMSTTTDGIHEPLDAETQSGLLAEIF